jgi:glucose/arabinose dehydrogenase
MRAVLLAALLLLALPAGAAAAPELVPVGSFSSPVALAAPPRDGSRLFVVEQGGTVRLIKDGAPLATPFADLTEFVQPGGEQGLLGLAFATDYAASGLAYVFLVRRGGDALEIRELQRSADPDRAVPGPGRPVLTVPHTQASNHNGGQLAFGPDGYLYAAIGDGGGANDPEDDAANPASLLGKILRIDARTGAPARGNPFDNEVWSYGLRNPWRFSFDRGTGDLLIGDVGQGLAEEINWARDVDGRGREVNFGWRCFEANQPTPGVDRTTCPPSPAGTQLPFLELPRSAGYRAVIGGFVVRDPGLPTLAGRYLFGDFARPELMSVALGDAGSLSGTGLSVAQLSSFGEDACGRIYTASLAGTVSRLQDGAPSPCTFPPEPAAPRPGGGGPTTAVATTTAVAAPDRFAPVLRIRYRGTQRLRRLRVTLRASEDCVVTVRARRFRTRRVALEAGARQVVRLKATRQGARRLRRAIARRGRVHVTIRLAARDAAGNVGVRRVRPGVVRRST